MRVNELLHQLHGLGLIASADATVTPLTGGVSSDIALIDDGQRKLVVKQALEKLRVRDDWRADVSRNRHEQAYLDYVARFRPDAVPRIVHRDPSRGFFVMEYLDAGFVNWKASLLAGEADERVAARAGQVLGEIHAHSWGDDEARRTFDTLANFEQLRIDPYLRTTGARQPDLKAIFDAEAARLSRASVCLVHGDYSPKNLMVGDDRLVVLDCECAWFGDPAFDVAFLLNHLLLKALYHRGNAAVFIALARAAWRAYRNALGEEHAAEVERNLCPLLLMLMLARVDGKSPVEYLDDEQREVIRCFVATNLSRPLCSLDKLLSAWERALRPPGGG